MIFDFNNDNNSINTTVVYNFTTKKSNFNKSLINERKFNKNKNKNNYKRNSTIQDNINFSKTFKINTNYQNLPHPNQNNFINNHVHKWKNTKIL